jgi:hypothetical protein
MSSALLKILPPTTGGILDSSTSFHHNIFSPRSVPPHPLEETLASKCPWIFRTTLQVTPYPLQPQIVPFRPPEEFLAFNYP